MCGVKSSPECLERAELGRRPVILTTPKEVETSMSAPTDQALKLQRSLPDDSLKMVARVERRAG